MQGEHDCRGDVKEKHRLKFDGTLTFGHVLTLASFIGAGAMFAIQNAQHFARQDAAIESSQNELRRLGGAFEKMAETQASMGRVQERISTLMEAAARDYPWRAAK